MEGELFLYSTEPRLCAFEGAIGGKTRAKAALVVVGGLTDGLLSVTFVPALAQQLQLLRITTVQPLFSSSYGGYGVGSLAQDSLELSKLLDHLRERRDKEVVILLGHSTGCQDILWYLKHHHRPEHHVLAVILQAPVSDRDYFPSVLPNWQDVLVWAETRCSAGRADEIYPALVAGVAMTAYRIRSLLAPQGDDDFFSVDASDAERRERFSGICMPAFVFFSSADESVPDKSVYATLTSSFERVSAHVKVMPLLQDADHGITTAEPMRLFCQQVAQICSTSVKIASD